MAILLDGKMLKQKKSETFKVKVQTLRENGAIPHLLVVQVGNDHASTIYINNKEKMATSLGIRFTKKKFDESISEEDFLSELNHLNNSNDIDGMIVQLPLPEHLSHLDVETLVVPDKDADGLHPINHELLKSEKSSGIPRPCTASGVMELLAEYNIKIKGKKVVVLGRSRIAGGPIALMAEVAGAKVSVFHRESSREELETSLKAADIIVTATGSRNVFTPEMVKDGVIIVDVGIIRDENRKIRGDISYADFMDKASHITPVPGGVGPMTVTMLMGNVILLCQNRRR